jgi:hypothetical protein
MSSRQPETRASSVGVGEAALALGAAEALALGAEEAGGLVDGLVGGFVGWPVGAVLGLTPVQPTTTATSITSRIN